VKLLIFNIGELAGIVPEGVMRKQGAEMSETGILKDAWLRVEDGLIKDFGPMADCPPKEGEVLDAEGGMVMPAFCDSHTHVVYAGSREGEFLDKIKGLSYEEIAARGGGILNSADLLHRTSEDELYEQSMTRVREVLAAGTGAIEIKSGYGLNPEDELKMLRVIKRIRKSIPAVVRSTFLGAHAVGRNYTHEEYVDEIVKMMPKAAELADYVDVFCDEGFFTTEDTDRILKAGTACGLWPKIHADELAVIGGVEVAVRHRALSVDHLERSGPAQIEALRGTATMPTMLPGSSFFLGIPYGHAKDFIHAGLGLALASDYNPGSSPSGDMRFVMALGCIRMRLTPVQAFNAVTLNSAYAMGVAHLAGSVTPGKLANLILTQPGWNLTRLAYHYRTPFIRTVLLRGLPLAN
jgi:imidazolonepropionase